MPIKEQIKHPSLVNVIAPGVSYMTSSGEYVAHELNVVYTYDRKVSCSDDHPIVYYVVNDDGKAVCEYCNKTFVYMQPDL